MIDKSNEVPALPEADPVALAVSVTQRNDLEERRAAERFPLQQKVQLRTRTGAGNTAAEGVTVDVSSTGVLIETEATLHAGETVELAMDWPVRLDNRVSLRLVAHGVVARAEPGRIAVTIAHYEFRTRPARG